MTGPAWHKRLLEQEEARSARNLSRFVTSVEPKPNGRLELSGSQTVIDLSSNDYLGLSRHPEVIAGAQEAVERYGTGARASPLVTGYHALMGELGVEVAKFKGGICGTIFPSGYQANLALLSTVLEADDAVFLDRLAHASLVDGVRLSPARLRVFPHNDLNRLEELLKGASKAPARWILVDGIYSMDGDFAPLPELLALAYRYDATVVMDDAHGTGVVGPNGRGTAEHFGVNPDDHYDRLIVVATLSKALGSQGGVICSEPYGTGLTDALMNARPYAYSTGLSPAAAGAALAALRLIQREPELPRRLCAVASEIRAEMRAAGLNVLGNDTPIIPIVVGEPAKALALSGRLRTKGVLVMPIRPPTVPRGTSRLRLTVNSAIDNDSLRSACRLVIELCCRTESRG